MKQTLIAIYIFFLSSWAGYSKPIQFADFTWGMRLLGVEAGAAESNFNLVEKEIAGANPYLKYKTFLQGKECTITFSFTPRGQRLYSVVIIWPPPSFGVFIRDVLMKKYQTPRQEIPHANLYLWTRLNTEVELRYGLENTKLSYSDLHIWREYREEKEILEEQAREKAEE